MTGSKRCRVRDWVEITCVLLEPEERSSDLPPETAAQPLVAWVKGFAKSEAGIGEELAVETMTGREVRGRLFELNPGYTHTFGKPAPELARVGRDLREKIAGYRATGG